MLVADGFGPTQTVRAARRDPSSDAVPSPTRSPSLKICITVIERVPADGKMERLRWIGASLARAFRAMGHDAVLERGSLVPAQWFVLVGVEHVAPDSDLHQLMAGKLPIAVIQDSELLSAEKQRPEAQAAFIRQHLPVLRAAGAVWEPLPTHLAVLRALGVKSRPYPFGAMGCPQPRRTDDGIDVHTFGAGGVAHLRRVRALSERGLSVLDTGWNAAPFRDDAMARASVLLVPENGDGTRLADPFVVMAMLAAGRPVVTAPMPGLEPYRGALVEVTDDALVDTVENLVRDEVAWGEAADRARTWAAAHDERGAWRAEFQAVGLPTSV